MAAGREATTVNVGANGDTQTALANRKKARSSKMSSDPSPVHFWRAYAVHSFLKTAFLMGWRKHGGGVGEEEVKRISDFLLVI